MSVTGATEQRADRTAGVSAEAVLEQVRQLALELHPRRIHSLRVTLDSALDSDLGFDSLCMANCYSGGSRQMK